MIRRLKSLAFRCLASFAIFFSAILLFGFLFSIANNAQYSLYSLSINIPSCKFSEMETVESYNLRLTKYLTAIDERFKEFEIEDILSEKYANSCLFATDEQFYSVKLSSYAKGIYLSKRKFSEKDNKLKSALDYLYANGILRLKFNKSFFRNADSHNPESAGIKTALRGTIYTILICMIISLPLGLMTAVYMEDFTDKQSTFINLLKANISNLAAVPSVIYGLVSLLIFVNIAGLPRSSSLIGGITLSLIALPTITTISMEAIRSVDKSITDAAMALGASKWQIIFKHKLKLALPGIVTGTIMASSRVIGETAPLILIGMVAFITKAPEKITQATSTLPVQIYLWSNNPDELFAQKASLAILVLLIILFAVNILANVIKYSFRVDKS